MIFFKESTIYAGYATLKAAEKAAVKFEFRSGEKVVIELCGSVYLIVGA